MLVEPRSWGQCQLLSLSRAACHLGPWHCLLEKRPPGWHFRGLLRSPPIIPRVERGKCTGGCGVGSWGPFVGLPLHGNRSLFRNTNPCLEYSTWEMLGGVRGEAEEGRRGQRQTQIWLCSTPQTSGGHSRRGVTACLVPLSSLSPLSPPGQLWLLPPRAPEKDSFSVVLSGQNPLLFRSLAWRQLSADRTVGCLLSPSAHF